MSEKLTEEELRQLRAEAMGELTRRLFSEHERQRADLTAMKLELESLRTELKRARINALNDLSELTALRDELFHAGQQLRDLLMVKP